MNQLNLDERAKVIACLIEGCSVRSTVRLTGVAKKTVLRLLVEAGNACTDYMDRTMRNLPCQRIECDEIWSFVYAKQKNVPDSMKGLKAGDAWCWVAIDPVSKLIPSWHVGNRDAAAASWFLHDLKTRLKHRVQLTTDGLRCYLDAVESAFGAEVDYAQLVKLYGNPPPQVMALEANPSAVRYSPPVCIGAEATTIQGTPDGRHVSTSIVERQNLTMRMGIRRFTRLTNGFSKKFENHCAAIALHFLHYNFCRIHQSLRVTPAMEAGICDHVWEISEIAALLDSK